MLISKLINRNKKEESTTSEPSEEQLLKEEEEAVKGERNLKRVLESARRLFLEKKIEGSIDVSRSFAFYTTSLSCTIDGSSCSGSTSSNSSGEDDVAAAVVEEGEREQLTRFERIVFSSLTKAVNNLESRAKAYRRAVYKDDLTLSTGLSLTDPFLGLSNLTISCSATVSSLLAISHSESKK
eukprot:gene3204-3509_t